MTGTGSIDTLRDARAVRLRELVERSNGTAAWLRERRLAAFDRFAALGFPTVRDEAWRHTDVSPIATAPFAPAPETAPAVTAEAVEAAALTGVAGPRIVLRNGHFAPERSSLGDLPRGVVAGSLAAALRDGHPALERHFGLHATADDRAFTALNAALFEDGVFIHLAAGARLETPLQILGLSTGAFEVHARVLVVAEEGSTALIAECWTGSGGAGFTNAVTEIAVGAGASVTHCRVQREPETARHVGRTQAVLARDARFESFALSLGALLARNDVDVVFEAQGGDCALQGLYLGGGRQHTDNQTFVDHAQPHCTSSQLYKGILGGEAHGVFNGRVTVRPKAQQTNAQQKNRNLILSETALADTKPQLEIYADDVRCTHGATIGRLDAEKIFYLRSRGVGERAAEEILTQAFAREVVERLGAEPVRRALEGWIGGRVARLIGGAA